MFTGNKIKLMRKKIRYEKKNTDKIMATGQHQVAQMVFSTKTII